MEVGACVWTFRPPMEVGLNLSFLLLLVSSLIFSGRSVVMEMLHVALQPQNRSCCFLVVIFEWHNKQPD